jgi:hypothetical protein
MSAFEMGVETLTQLRSLTLYSTLSNTGSNFEVAVLAPWMSSLQQLRELHLEELALVTKELKFLAELPNLKRISGQADTRLRPADFSVASRLPLANLTAAFTTEQIPEVQRCLQRGLHPALQTLTMWWNIKRNSSTSSEDEEGHAASSLIAPLAAAPGLSALSLRGPWELSNDIVKQLAPLTQLTYLGFSARKIESEEALKGLSALTGLQTLSFRDARPAQ